MAKKIKIYKSFEEEEKDRIVFMRSLTGVQRLHLVYKRVKRYYGLKEVAKDLKGKKWSVRFLEKN